MRIISAVLARFRQAVRNIARFVGGEITPEKPIPPGAHTMKLHGMADPCRAQVETTHSCELSLEKRFGLLADQQCLWKENRSLARRLQSAKLKDIQYQDAALCASSLTSFVGSAMRAASRGGSIRIILENRRANDAVVAPGFPQRQRQPSGRCRCAAHFIRVAAALLVKPRPLLTPQQANKVDALKKACPQCFDARLRYGISWHSAQRQCRSDGSLWMGKRQTPAFTR